MLLDVLTVNKLRQECLSLFCRYTVKCNLLGSKFFAALAIYIRCELESKSDSTVNINEKKICILIFNGVTTCGQGKHSLSRVDCKTPLYSNVRPPM